MAKQVDVAIIGAGPAGLAAAIKAKESGAENVVIFERAEAPGGLLDQCVHNGFGLLYFGQDLTGPEYAKRFIEKALDLKVRMQLETMVTRITAGRETTVVSRNEGISTFKPQAIVLSMGCRERPRDALGIPGSRPSGILTAGTAQRFVNIEGFVPGKKIVILGSGDVGMIMARRLTLEGAKVEAVIEILPYIGGLIRNEVQCVHDFNIPLFLEHTVTMVHGADRVEAVTVARVDARRKPVPGTEVKIECDTLLLSVGLIPENELSLMAGVELDSITGGPVVDETMQTNVAGIFAGGNAVHVHDLVDNVTWESELAGVSAAGFAVGDRPARGAIVLKAGRNMKYIVPHTIRGERPVTLYARVNQPEEGVRLKVGDILTKSLRAVKPSEMVKVDLLMEQLRKLPVGATELTIDCQKRGSAQSD